MIEKLAIISTSLLIVSFTYNIVQFIYIRNLAKFLYSEGYKIRGIHRE